MLFRPKVIKPLKDKPVSETEALEAAAGKQESPRVPTPVNPAVPEQPQATEQVVTLEEFNILAESFNAAVSFLESYKNLLAHAVTLNEEQKDEIKSLEKKNKSLKEDLEEKNKKK